MKKLIIYISLFFMVNNINAQKSLLQSGPMLGYSEMREVLIWVQTKQTAEVYIKYSDKQLPGKKYLTNKVKTNKQTAFTAKLLADSVEPGRIYDYELFINNTKIDFSYPLSFQTQKLWLWRGKKPEQRHDIYDFSFAAGSGTYINEKKYDRPGEPYGGDYQIFDNIADDKPDFMLWLGDNVYLRESDWNTRTGIFHRYTHTRSTPEMQKLLATTHNYAILDDHDFGPNDSDRSFWNKKETMNAFELFWANPSVGVGDIKGAITTFSWADCEFFLLDNRYYRTPDRRKTGEHTQLGKEQLEWLKDVLTYSKASFKFVVMGGQILTTSGLFETYSNYGYSKEREEIIRFIHDEEINNVVFITGDRHHSEVSVLDRTYKPKIYDITCSPLTSHSSNKHKDEVNPLRVEGSLINEKNYTEFKLTGSMDERILSVIFKNTQGKEIYKYIIKKVNKKHKKK